MNYRKLLAPLTLALAFSTAWAAPCEPSNFVVKNVSTRQDFGYVTFVGTIVNGSSVRCAVQLNASTYDKNGVVLETKTFWPFSSRALAPESSENFSTFMRDVKGTTAYEFVPIAVRY